jgi:hypothetical protein
MRSFLNHNPDVLQVLMAHALAMFVNVTNLADWLKVLSLMIAIGYTVWKWVYEYKKTKSLNEKSKTNTHVRKR